LGFLRQAAPLLHIAEVLGPDRLDSRLEVDRSSRLDMDFAVVVAGHIWTLELRPRSR
jgi:hypothetical protein